MTDPGNIKTSKKDYKERAPFGFSKIHPYKIMLGFSLVGVSMLFIGMSIAYLVVTEYSTWNDIQIPSVFYISTALILFSSWTIRKSMKSFKQLNHSSYRIWLALTFVVGLMFIITQCIGWFQLTLEGVELQNNMSGSYLYLISGLHAVHVLAGLIALGAFVFKALIQTSNGLIAMVYFTDPLNKLRIDFTWNLLAFYRCFVGFSIRILFSKSMARLKIKLCSKLNDLRIF